MTAGSWSWTPSALGDPSGREDETRVLHVDDSRHSVEMTAERLEAERDRFVVYTETDPELALTALEERPTDCVVSAYDMPSMDGLELLSAVREKRPRLPFILFTGTDSAELAEQALSAGVTDYLPKRRDAHQYTLLSKRIENAVERSRAEGRYRLLLDALEAAGEGVSVFDEDRFVYANSAFAETYGYDRATLIGADLRTVYSETAVERIVGEVLPSLGDGEVWREEAVGVTQDGTPLLEEHSLSRIDDGRLVCVVRGVAVPCDR